MQMIYTTCPSRVAPAARRGSTNPDRGDPLGPSTHIVAIPRRDHPTSCARCASSTSLADLNRSVSSALASEATVSSVDDRAQPSVVSCTGSPSPRRPCPDPARRSRYNLPPAARFLPRLCEHERRGSAFAGASAPVVTAACLPRRNAFAPRPRSPSPGRSDSRQLPHDHRLLVHLLAAYAALPCVAFAGVLFRFRLATCSDTLARQRATTRLAPSRLHFRPMGERRRSRRCPGRLPDVHSGHPRGSARPPLHCHYNPRPMRRASALSAPARDIGWRREDRSPFGVGLVLTSSATSS